MSFWSDYNCNRYDPDSHDNRIVCDSEYVTEKELSDAKDLIIVTTKEYADEYTVDQAKEYAEGLQTAFENEFSERADTFENGIDTRVTAVENAETAHEATVTAELSGFEARVTATESVAGTASTDAANAVATANLANTTADSAEAIATEAKNTADVASARLDTAIDAVTTDTEVTDIRVGADGTTYDTAGNAVRGQVNEIKKDLYGEPVNVLYYANTTGGWVDPNTGNITSSTTWKVTDFINVSGCKEIVITTDKKSTYNAWYNEDKSWNKALVTNLGEGVYQVPANAKYIRLSNTNANLNVTTINGIIDNKITSIENRVAKLEEDNKPKYFKICTYNVGLFNNGLSYVTTENAPEKIAYFKRTIGEIDADVINTQEMTRFVDQATGADNAYRSNIVLQNKYIDSTSDVRSALIPTSFSKYTMTNKYEGTFTSGSGKHYVSFDITVGGKTITIINAHLAIEEDPAIHRDAEIEELIDIMDAKEYVILTGDFNTRYKTEIDTFKNAGYTVCNGGDFGWFYTWAVVENMPEGWSTTWDFNSLDHIIVSNNIKVQNVKTVNSKISDHAPLVAELLIE